MNNFKNVFLVQTTLEIIHKLYVEKELVNEKNVHILTQSKALSKTDSSTSSYYLPYNLFQISRPGITIEMLG